MAGIIQYLVVFGLLLSQGHSNSEATGTQVEGDQLVLRTLDRFAPAHAGDFKAYFDAIRPHKLADSMKAQVLGSLPTEGEARPSADAADKLKSISPILAYHDRESVIEVKVIRVFQAAVAVYARCVLLVSEEALRLLTPAELQALVAHELGHEYVWDELESAKSAGDHQKIPEMELWCDGVAILTLLDLGLDPQALPSAISKLDRFNRRFGTPDNIDDYPTDRTRSEFHRTLSGLFADARKRRQQTDK